jgi:putative MATE family efflux protein
MEICKKQEENEREMNDVRESFLTLPLGRLMLKNALPAISSMLFMALYQSIDAMLVGRRFGPEALASVNILYPILAILIGLAVMIGVGGNARIAVLMGAGDISRANRILGLIAALGLGLGITGSLGVRMLYSQILAVLGTSDMLGIYAGEYLSVMYLFFTPMILFFILEQSLRNDGQAGMTAIIMASMAVLNIILDYVFLFVLDLGIGGAALATGISQSLGCCIFVGYFISKLKTKKGGLRFAIPEGGFSVFRAIIANGSSEFFNSLAVGVTTFLFNRLILNHVGSLGVATFAITQYLLAFVMMFLMGLGNGVQPIISYNHGAGLTKRVVGTLWRTMTVSVVIGLFFFIAMRTQIASLTALFVPDYPNAIAATLVVARTVSWSMLFLPFGMVLTVFFTALEKARASLVIALCRGFVFTVTGLALFPPLLGEYGIWITPVFAEGATALVGALMLYRWLHQNASSFQQTCIN